VLAALVVANSLYEMKFGRRRSLGRATWSLGEFLSRAVKTLATFATIVVLWSLWTAESFSSWLSMWSVAVTADDLIVPALLGLVVIVAGVISYAGSRTSIFQGAGLALQTSVTACVLVPLMLAGLPPVYERLGSETASVVATLKSGRLSRNDMAALEKGYYEDLMAVNHINSQLSDVYMKKPLEWLDIQGTGLVQLRDDFLQRELPASRVSKDSFSTTTTNRWGMRDKDYERLPPNDTYRMAVLGASISMGWGVNDGETYESLVEDRLNAAQIDGKYSSYEILNLAVAGYYPLQQAAVLDKALPFEPNAVVYVATGREFSRSVYYLAHVTHSRIDVPFPGLQDIAARAGLEAGMSEDEASRRLTPFREELLDWLYHYVVETCHRNGVTPVWLFIPQTYGGSWKEETSAAAEIAEKAGFVTIDLRDLYDGHDVQTLQLAEWDAHPNARGHELIADRFFEGILARKDALELVRPQNAQAP
jgi:hypothetical protein